MQETKKYISMESLLKVAFTERCKRPSCTTTRTSDSEYCKSHTRKTKPCKEPGCKFLEYTEGYCRTHGGKKCTIPGCTNVQGVGIIVTCLPVFKRVKKKPPLLESIVLLMRVLYPCVPENPPTWGDFVIFIVVPRRKKIRYFY